MQKSQFKHKKGDLIGTTGIEFGKIISGKVVYEVQFSKDDIRLVDEDAIATEPKRARKTKEFLQPHIESH